MFHLCSVFDSGRQHAPARQQTLELLLDKGGKPERVGHRFINSLNFGRGFSTDFHPALRHHIRWIASPLAQGGTSGGLEVANSKQLWGSSPTLCHVPQQTHP